MTPGLGSADAARLVEELAHRSDALAALDAIGKIAARTPDLHDFLGDAFAVVEATTGCAGMAAYAIEPGSRTLALLHERGMPPELRGLLSRVPVEAPSIATTHMTAADVIAPDAYSPPFREMLHGLGVRAMVRVPLMVGTRVVGVLAVSFGEPGPREAARHLQLLGAVGALVAAVISAVGLRADQGRRISELTVLNDVTVASVQLDPVLLLDRAVRRTAEVFGCELGAAFLRAQDRLQNVFIFGVRPDALPSTGYVPHATGPVGLAVEKKDVVVFSDPEEAGGGFAEAVRGEGLRGIVGVPLLTKDGPVGGFVLGRRTDRPFDGEEVRFLKTLGVQLGVAVQNARLYADARMQIAHLESVHALALRIFGHPPGDVDALLADGCREIARALGAEQAAAFLVSDDGQALQGRAAHGTRPGVVGLAFPLEANGLAVDAVRRGLAVQTPDSSTDPRCFPPDRARSRPSAVLAIPLAARDAVRGVLFVGDRPGREFSEPEVALGRALGAALAVGLENAGLRVDLGRSHAELERAQEQLLQRERLAALGALSAAVAHEVRNPLGVIFNAVGMLRRHRAMDGEGRGLLDMVGEEAERLNRIVTDLLGFARQPVPVIRPEPLKRVVEEAVRAALASSRVPVDAVVEVPDDLPAVRIDAGMVRQAVLNVALNAVQAMPRGGRLTVRVARRDGMLDVDVVDTGAGIPDELRARIFEPFFTTKTTGTGLGLAIVKQVVEAHGGAVDHAAASGGGTRFTLRFPMPQPPGAAGR